MGFIQDQDLESTEVDFGEGQVTVYFRPMNLFEMDLVDKAQAKGKVEGVVETVMARSRLDSGLLMFSKDDRSKVVKQFDPDAVLDLVNAMSKFDAGRKLGN